MLLAAMLDAGVALESLERELTKIVPDEFQLTVSATRRGSIDAVHLEVSTGADAREFLDWNDFRAAVENSSLPRRERALIASIFECLREAEAQAHGTAPGDTRLHELGTIDTLIDISGAVIGMRLLGVEKVYASPLPASLGVASSSHGISPSIAPATMAIIQSAQLPLMVSGGMQPSGESVTPTGAAIIATLADFQSAEMTIKSIGYGAGARQSDNPPNVLGFWVGETRGFSTRRVDTIAGAIGVAAESDTTLIETNIDDMTGEQLGHVLGMLMKSGARDAWLTPIQMKKNRPAVLLSALMSDEDAYSIASLIFVETTSLGLRLRSVDRLVADREAVNAQTRFGDARVKVKRIAGRVMQVAPEYDECARIALEHGLPLAEVMDHVRADARKSFMQSDRRDGD